VTFTKLYLTNRAAPYTPATIRGAWDDTSAAVTNALDPRKEGGGVITDVYQAETSTSNEYDVLLYRGVSGPLAAQTINCDVNCIIGARESSTSADLAFHVHIYVTQGDSDSVRATLLSDYIESSEWSVSTTADGRAFASAQAVNQAISDGDRLVLEIGYRALNTSSTSYTGYISYAQRVAEFIGITERKHVAQCFAFG
jgi:hypothetical protein